MVELFSGLGSQNRAFSNAVKKRNYTLKVKNISEWNIHALVAYDLIHNDNRTKDPKLNSLNRETIIKYLKNVNLSNDGVKPINEKFLKSLPLDTLKQIYRANVRTKNLSDISKIKGNEIPKKLDVLTYSFPCQDLSSGGFIHGYGNGIDKQHKTRSGLLWQVERIIKERLNDKLDLPRFLVMENVVSLNAKRHKKHFDEWTDYLHSIGYHNKIYKLDATNFGIPQKRIRIIMISTYMPKIEDNSTIEEYYRNNNLEEKRLKMRPLSDFIKNDTEGTYFQEALKSQPNNTRSRLKIWENNLVLLNEQGSYSEFTQTITTKQDRHPNNGNVYFNYIGNTKSKYRNLTPRECFLLMGFDENDVNKLLQSKLKSRSNSFFFSSSILYKLAGNSIVVNVLESVFNQIIDLNELIYK